MTTNYGNESFCGNSIYTVFLNICKFWGFNTCWSRTLSLTCLKSFCKHKVYKDKMYNLKGINLSEMCPSRHLPERWDQAVCGPKVACLQNTNKEKACCECELVHLKYLRAVKSLSFVYELPAFISRNEVYLTIVLFGYLTNSQSNQTTSFWYCFIT